MSCKVRVSHNVSVFVKFCETKFGEAKLPTNIVLVEVSMNFKHNLDTQSFNVVLEGFL
jgi:hypothetical protein